MKIRTSYVSNSSSSSFVILGRYITGDIKKLLEEGKEIFVIVEEGGTSGDCEDWIMKLDEASYSKLNKSAWFKRQEPKYILSEVPVLSRWDDEEGFDKLSVLNDAENVSILYFDRDYSSPDNFKQLLKFLEGRD